MKILNFEEFLNESIVLTGKTIWKMEKSPRLENRATDKFDEKVVEKFLETIENNSSSTETNLIKVALEPFETVEVTIKEGPVHPNRCFLSSLEYCKDDEKNQSVVGILRRKGSNLAWVHAFNKNGETYFDNSLKQEELKDYLHYPLASGIVAKDEEGLATVAWVYANSLQRAAEMFLEER